MNLKNKVFGIQGIAILVLFSFTASLLIWHFTKSEEWRLYDQIHSKPVWVEWMYLKIGGDKYRKNKKNALPKLLKMGDKAVLPFIYLLDDKNSEVRSSAAKALGEIGDKRAVPPLIKTLLNKNDWARYEAVEALGKIGDKRVIEPLNECLLDKDMGFRVASADILARLGDNRGFDYLINALGKNDNANIDSAAIVLGSLGDKRAIKPLLKCLRMKEGWVDYEVQEALRKLGYIVKLQENESSVASGVVRDD